MAHDVTRSRCRTEYQAELRDTLAARLGVEVHCEWAAFPGMAMYSPRVDVAVGPLSIEQGSRDPEYRRLLDLHRTFFQDLLTAHDTNVMEFDPTENPSDWNAVTTRNWNARCLIAIEIENQSSRKHLMGSAINASSLGRIGLAVGWDDDRVRRFVRLRRYLRALSRLKKNTFDTTNLVIVSREQLSAVLR